MDPSIEHFDVLTPDGTPTGVSKPRSDVHRDGDWHACVHIWVIDAAKKRVRDSLHIIPLRCHYRQYCLRVESRCHLTPPCLWLFRISVGAATAACSHQRLLGRFLGHQLCRVRQTAHAAAVQALASRLFPQRFVCLATQTCTCTPLSSLQPPERGRFPARGRRSRTLRGAWPLCGAVRPSPARAHPAAAHAPAHTHARLAVPRQRTRARLRLRSPARCSAGSGQPTATRKRSLGSTMG
jgi:hypothetical protein